MKSDRRTLQQLGTPALLILVLAIVILTRPTDRIRYEIPELTDVSSQSIDSLTVTSATGEVTVRRGGLPGIGRVEDLSWRIEDIDRRADPDLVDAMLDAVTSLTLVDIVAVRAQSYGAFDLDVGSRLRVVARSGSRILRAFDVGSRAATFSHTFVTLPDDPAIYHADGEIRGVFDHRAATLRDKRAIAFDRSAVTRITGTRGGSVTTLVNGPDGWQLTVNGSDTDTALSDEQVDGLFARLAGLRAVAFLDAAPAPATVVLVVETGTGGTSTQHRLDLAPDGADYRGTSTNLEDPIRIAGWQIDGILNILSTATN